MNTSDRKIAELKTRIINLEKRVLELEQAQKRRKDEVSKVKQIGFKKGM